jgi:hypothetical protein
VCLCRIACCQKSLSIEQLRQDAERLERVTGTLREKMAQVVHLEHSRADPGLEADLKALVHVLQGISARLRRNKDPRFDAVVLEDLLEASYYLVRCGCVLCEWGFWLTTCIRAMEGPARAGLGTPPDLIVSAQGKSAQ